MWRSALIVAAVLATVSLQASSAPVEGGPIYKRPQEIGETSGFTAYIEDQSFGNALVPDGAPNIVGGNGVAWLTSSGASLNNPVELTAPSGAGGSFGSAVNTVRAPKQVSSRDLNGASQDFVWLFVAASASNTVYAMNDIDFVEDPTNASFTVNTAKGPTGYDDSQALTPSGAPSGTYTPRAIYAAGRSTAAGNQPDQCLYSDAIVIYNGASRGYIVIYKYDGRVPTTETGEWSQTSLVTGEVANFGFDSARHSNNAWVVTATGNSRAYLYLYSADGNDCTSSITLSATITPASNGGSFGDSVSMGRGGDGAYVVAVGAPTRGSGGAVDLFRIASGTSSLLQTLTPPTDDTFEPPVAPVAGMRFGDDLALGDTNFLLVGAPAYSARGGLFFYQLNETTGDLEFEFPLNLSSEAIPSNAALGSSITHQCRTFYFGVPALSTVLQQSINIGAFYDDYCTCNQVAQDPPMYYAQYASGVSPTALCNPVLMSVNRICLLEDANSICNYQGNTAWFFTEELPANPEGQQFECLEDTRLVRRTVAANCFYDYGILGTPA